MFSEWVKSLQKETWLDSDRRVDAALVAFFVGGVSLACGVVCFATLSWSRPVVVIVASGACLIGSALFLRGLARLRAIRRRLQQQPTVVPVNLCPCKERLVRSVDAHDIIGAAYVDALPGMTG